MYTKYGLYGKIRRYPGFYIIFLFIAFHMILPRFGEEFLSRPVLMLFIFIFSSMECLILWFHPIVKIEESGILVSRLIFVKRRVKWMNIKLKKKLRTFTQYGQIGMDPRYALIIIKDGFCADKYIFILPYFKDYDEFVGEIERHLDTKDIVTDENYY